MSNSVIIALEAALKSIDAELSKEERDFIASCQNWPNALVDVSSSIFSARLTERAIRAHAAALDRASQSSDRAAGRLALATWALVVATVVLAIATIALFFK